MAQKRKIKARGPNDGSGNLYQEAAKSGRLKKFWHWLKR